MAAEPKVVPNKHAKGVDFQGSGRAARVGGAWRRERGAVCWWRGGAQSLVSLFWTLTQAAQANIPTPKTSCILADQSNLLGIPTIQRHV